MCNNGMGMDDKMVLQDLLTYFEFRMPMLALILFSCNKIK